MPAKYPSLTKCPHLTPLAREDAIKTAESLLDRSAHEDVKAVLHAMRADDGVLCAEIEYKYGDLVVDDGIFKLPGVQGRLNQASKEISCEKCGKLQKHFTTENPVPLLLNLTKPLEVFRIYTDIYKDTKAPRGYRTVPIAFREPGELIGLFEYLRAVLHYPASYGRFYVSAGSRNVHLVLPLTPTTSSLASQDTIESAFPRSDTTLTIRSPAKKMDVSEYKLPEKVDDGLGPQKNVNFDGIASDWRIIRTFAGDQTWKAKLLMVLLDPSRNEEPCDSALTLFRAAFYQLQDALAAFTADAPSHVGDKSIFMNVETPSVPTVLNHLAASVAGEHFVHAPADTGDGKGPWIDLFKAVASIRGDEYEVRYQRYFPFILEPRKLNLGCSAGFMSFVHLLVPQVLYLEERANTKWIKGFKGSKGSEGTPDFITRLKRRGLYGFVQEYPRTTNEKNNFGEEGIEILMMKNSSCWPAIIEDNEMVNPLRKILPASDVRKLSRLTCLRDFMTVRHHGQTNVKQRGAASD